MYTTRPEFQLQLSISAILQKINLSYSPTVQSAVRNRNATLHVAIITPSTAVDHNQLALNKSTKRTNHFVLHNSRRLFVDEKLLCSSPGRVANVTRSNQIRNIKVQAPNFSTLFEHMVSLTFVPSTHCGS